MITMVNSWMVSFKITVITELWPFLNAIGVIFDTTDITDPTKRSFWWFLSSFFLVFNFTFILGSVASTVLIIYSKINYKWSNCRSENISSRVVKLINY